MSWAGLAGGHRPSAAWHTGHTGSDDTYGDSSCRGEARTPNGAAAAHTHIPADHYAHHAQAHMTMHGWAAPAASDEQRGGERARRLAQMGRWGSMSMRESDRGGDMAPQWGISKNQGCRALPSDSAELHMDGAGGRWTSDGGTRPRSEARHPPSPPSPYLPPGPLPNVWRSLTPRSCRLDHTALILAT